MENLTLAVIRRLGKMMPELATIDEDYGQLAYDEAANSYPVVFPAAFVGNINISWATHGRVQQGKGKFTVRLAIDCYDDTHLGSGTEEKIAERHALNAKKDRCLQGFQTSYMMDGLERVENVDYTLQGPGNIKVFDTTFAFEIVDEEVTLPL